MAYMESMQSTLSSLIAAGRLAVPALTACSGR